MWLTRSEGSRYYYPASRERRCGHDGLNVREGIDMASLGQLEAAVMERLWSWDRPVSVRDVLEDIQRDRVIAYTTVMTVLDNLHRKGMVIREKVGRAYVYRPSRSRERHTADLMEQALSGTGDRGAALMHFVREMSPDEVRELKRALDALDRSSVDSGDAT